VAVDEGFPDANDVQSVDTLRTQRQQWDRGPKRTIATRSRAVRRPKKSTWWTACYIDSPPAILVVKAGRSVGASSNRAVW